MYKVVTYAPVKNIYQNTVTVIFVALAQVLCLPQVLALLQNKDGPTIALSMGEKGQIVRLLAAKYGGYLTFAAMSSERASAPGQPTIQQLKGLYR